jgi:hypothetical protein
MAFRKKQSNPSRSGSETRKRAPIIGFRATEAERKEIEASAQRAGLTVGSYVRSRALKKHETRAVRKPPVEAAQLAKLLGMLGAAGGALQLLAKQQSAGNEVTSQVFSEAMAAFREAAEVIIHALGKHPHLSQEVHHRSPRHDH